MLLLDFFDLLTVELSKINLCYFTLCPDKRYGITEVVNWVMRESALDYFLDCVGLIFHVYGNYLIPSYEIDGCDILRLGHNNFLHFFITSLVAPLVLSLSFIFKNCLLQLNLFHSDSDLPLFGPDSENTHHTKHESPEVDSLQVAAHPSLHLYDQIQTIKLLRHFYYTE
jgi:hypothetical protein